jgi:hypothetical protein
MTYLKHFPKPLLSDLVAGRWLPVVGAGFSRNAVLPPNKVMPLWPELGNLFSEELADYEPSNPIDAISAFEHEYGRPKLVERLAEFLHINQTRPGPAHRAFCSIPFDIVCTTNFDFLIEQQYESIPRNCTPLVDEEQLSINADSTGVSLLKLHGDLRHPARLIASEGDYDKFLTRYPLIATFLANLLITRTAILIGYSLDDPDFRQVWQVVGERLGRSRRTAYAIVVGAKPGDIARFDRRGVKVVNLPSGRGKYGDILAAAFDELRVFWRASVIPSSQVKEEQSLRELSLPADAQTRLCFFAIPLELLSYYREKVFPIVREHGFVPISADDVVTPGDTVLPKVDALVDRALLMIVDASTEATRSEYRLALERVNANRLLLISSTNPGVQSWFERYKVIRRPDINREDSDQFLEQIDSWLREQAATLRPLLLAEPTRLFNVSEYRAAVISAISLLESMLRRRVDLPRASSPKAVTLRELVRQAKNQGVFGEVPEAEVTDWIKIRNEVVHGTKSVQRERAETIVKGVSQIVQMQF